MEIDAKFEFFFYFGLHYKDLCRFFLQTSISLKKKYEGMVLKSV